MNSYRMSVPATVYFLVNADSPEEAIQKAREVEHAFAAPHVLDVEHKHIEEGDVELYIDHTEQGPEVEEEYTEPPWMRDGGRS
jgi:hypothetical protein